MADVPRPQRIRRRRRGNIGQSAAPTADDTPSGIAVTRNARRRRNRRGRVNRLRRRRLVPFVGPLLPGEERRLVPAFPRRFLTRRIKAELRREGLEGPKVAVQQRITSTFGLIGPNTSGNVEMELNFFTHPSLAKEANDGTAFGPLQALAAQYALWKIKFLTLRFTPMVGSSAVSGTVVRASLNLSQSPGGSNWSGLGTRIHMDMHPGQVSTFHLRGDQIGGPRDGGWWFTDTNEEGSQSAGPIVEIHTLGKTLSTFKDQPWDGPLFLVEGIGLWQFANYQVKPALGQLERREADVQAQLETTAGQPIILDLPADNTVTQFMVRMEPETGLPDPRNPDPRVPVIPNLGGSVGETVFQVVDIGAKLASEALPIPFGWLIKGGWWFVKRLFGRRASGNKIPFVVYASLADAQNNKPAIATQTVPSNATKTKLLVTQINNPNVGPNPAVPAARNIVHQILRPGDNFRVSSPMLSEVMINVQQKAGTFVKVPVSAIPGTGRGDSGNPITIPSSGSVANDTILKQVKYIQTPWWIGPPGKAPALASVGQPNSVTNLPSAENGGYVQVLYRLINPRFTDQSGDIDYFEPDYRGDVQFAMLENFQTDGNPSVAKPYVPYGSVVASSLIHSSATTPSGAFHMVFDLIKTYQSFQGYDPGQPGTSSSDDVKDLFVLYGDNVGNFQFVALPKELSQEKWKLLQRTFPVNTYFLAVSITNKPVEIRGTHVPTTVTLGTYSRVESAISPVFPYDLIGHMIASTSVDMMLTVPRRVEVNEYLVEQLKAMGITADGVEPVSAPPLVNLSESGPSWWPYSDVHSDQESPESDDSVHEFWDRVGDDMIPIPTRWVHDAEMRAQLGIDD
uniref:Capsid protein n=1 Tax=Bat astrovirus Tm/Guangxi/LD54/2007 TaxID=627581 RepID=C0KCU7_9VIRU|nr:capsid protein precursor [Bat astrovirus Tm/Guangxi/LD54/2007]